MCEGLRYFDPRSVGQLRLSTQLSLPGQDGSSPASSGCSLVLAARPRSLPAPSQTPWCRVGRASNAHICSKWQGKQRQRDSERRVWWY